MLVRLTDDVTSDKLFKYEVKTRLKSPSTIHAFLFFYVLFLPGTVVESSLSEFPSLGTFPLNDTCKKDREGKYTTQRNHG